VSARNADKKTADPDLRAVLDRLKEVEGVRFDVELAEPLGVTRARLEQWKARGTFPWTEIQAYADGSGVSLEWLVHGRGPREVGLMLAEDAGDYHVHEIDTDLFMAVTNEVQAMLKEAGLPADDEKAAYLVAYVYNDLVKSGATAPDRKKIEGLMRLIA